MCTHLLDTWAQCAAVLEDPRVSASCTLARMQPWAGCEVMRVGLQQETKQVSNRADECIGAQCMEAAHAGASTLFRNCKVHSECPIAAVAPESGSAYISKHRHWTSSDRLRQTANLSGENA